MANPAGSMVGQIQAIGVYSVAPKAATEPERHFLGGMETAMAVPIRQPGLVTEIRFGKCVLRNRDL